jgi:hypothetical protein
MSGVAVDQELRFTDRLIGSNFSNYSSWHYRSTLLPLLHLPVSSVLYAVFLILYP